MNLSRHGIIMCCFVYCNWLPYIYWSLSKHIGIFNAHYLFNEIKCNKWIHTYVSQRLYSQNNTTLYRGILFSISLAFKASIAILSFMIIFENLGGWNKAKVPEGIYNGTELTIPLYLGLEPIPHVRLLLHILYRIDYNGKHFCHSHSVQRRPQAFQMHWRG